jgi:hypothetical protein
MLTRVNVDVSRIKSNRETGSRDPVIRVVRDGQEMYTHRLEILGPSAVVYDPTRPGTTCWIETEAEIVLEERQAAASGV